MEKEYKPWEYIIDRENRTVEYTIPAHDKLFIGKATCKETDTFDEETGKTIAQMRAELAQRTYDLKLTRQFLTVTKGMFKKIKKRNKGIASPHFIRAIQAGTEEEMLQLEHVNDLKERLRKFYNE